MMPHNRAACTFTKKRKRTDRASESNAEIQYGVGGVPKKHRVEEIYPPFQLNSSPYQDIDRINALRPTHDPLVDFYQESDKQWYADTHMESLPPFSVVGQLSTLRDDFPTQLDELPSPIFNSPNRTLPTPEAKQRKSVYFHPCDPTTSFFNESPGRKNKRTKPFVPGIPLPRIETALRRCWPPHIIGDSNAEEHPVRRIGVPAMRRRSPLYASSTNPKRNLPTTRGRQTFKMTKKSSDVEPSSKARRIEPRNETSDVECDEDLPLTCLLRLNSGRSSSHICRRSSSKALTKRGDVTCSLARDFTAETSKGSCLEPQEPNDPLSAAIKVGHGSLGRTQLSKTVRGIKIYLSPDNAAGIKLKLWTTRRRKSLFECSGKMVKRKRKELSEIIAGGDKELKGLFCTERN